MFCQDEYSLLGPTKAGRMERRAMRQRWAIPKESKDRIIARQIEIAQNESAREATAAARVLVSMELQNQNDDNRMPSEVFNLKPIDPLTLDAIRRFRIASPDAPEISDAEASVIETLIAMEQSVCGPTTMTADESQFSDEEL